MYFFCGFSWQGFAAGPAHVVAVAGKSWNWIAAEPFFLRGLQPEGSPASLVALLQMFSVGLAALIPLGAGTDRWRLGAACASTALLAGCTYPIFAHWVWGGGWLAQLGVNCGLGRGFLDAGGAGCIQAVGGLTAWSIACILGPRRGKYAMDGAPAAIPGHNAVLVLLGCFLALLGWFGLNCAGSILFAGAAPGARGGGGHRHHARGRHGRAGGGGHHAGALRPAGCFPLRQWMGRRVWWPAAPACAFLTPAAAAMTGLVAGALVTFSVEWLDIRLGVDDPAGSISVHAIGGIWGVLALGIFARFPGDSGQFVAQLAGVATLLGFVLPLTYSLNWLLNRFYPQRVAAEGERQGMDLYELGAGAYPEFVIHREDLTQG